MGLAERCRLPQGWHRQKVDPWVERILTAEPLLQLGYKFISCDDSDGWKTRGLKSPILETMSTHLQALFSLIACKK